MAKPYLKINVIPANAHSFVLEFTHVVDMEITRDALARAGHMSDVMYPQLGGVVYTTWLMEIIKRGCMGDRINTIKMVRTLSRVGLKEAKDFADEYLTD